MEGPFLRWYFLAKVISKNVKFIASTPTLVKDKILTQNTHVTLLLGAENIPIDHT